MNKYDPEYDVDEFISTYSKPLSNHVANTSGIDFSQYNEIPVECSGRSPVSPISTWTDVDLSKILHKNIKDAKYSNPTPVQRYSLPIVLNGRDLMSCAQTGSGKTAAFLLPCLATLLVIIFSIFFLICRKPPIPKKLVTKPLPTFSYLHQLGN